MANLKEIRTRIASVKSTRQITSAMKMVSAAKLRKAQDAVLQIRPYADSLEKVIFNIVSALDSDCDNCYSDVRDEKKVLIVVIGSNKGLCGAFNANLIKKTMQIIETEYSELHQKKMVDVITIGRKVFELLKSRKISVKERHDDLVNHAIFQESMELAEIFMEQFSNKNYDRVIMVYNQFKNAGSQEVKSEVLLPIDISDKPEESIPDNSNYILEPDANSIIGELIPRSIIIRFFKALLDSMASEHGARMTSMHKATDNATELIKELTLHYNKARQASITNEILEIVGGAEALKNG